LDLSFEFQVRNEKGERNEEQRIIEKRKSGGGERSGRERSFHKESPKRLTA
jgi:hypothetical protein